MATFPDTDIASLARAVDEAFRRLNQERPKLLQLVVVYAEPERPRDGMIVYADGTEWDPGSGLGFYGYENGSWVKL